MTFISHNLPQQKTPAIPQKPSKQKTHVSPDSENNPFWVNLSNSPPLQQRSITKEVSNASLKTKRAALSTLSPNSSNEDFHLPVPMLEDDFPAFASHQSFYDSPEQPRKKTPTTHEVMSTMDDDALADLRPDPYSFESPIKRPAIAEQDEPKTPETKFVFSSHTDFTVGHTSPPPKAKVCPPAPNNAYKSRPVLEGQETDEAKAKKQKIRFAKAVWQQIRENCTVHKTSVYVGEGNFHTVFSEKPDEVVKIPTLEEEDKGEVCFLRIRYAHKDYEQMVRLQNAGKFPPMFRVANTHFNEDTAVITQEKCDRLFRLDDLQKPEVLQTLQTLFWDGYEGRHNIDLKPDNLGWKNGQLVLIDFREEDVESAGAFYTNMNNFLKAFSKKDKNIRALLDPRVNGLSNVTY